MPIGVICMVDVLLHVALFMTTTLWPLDAAE
jgi:hypothetical protein